MPAAGPTLSCSEASSFTQPTNISGYVDPFRIDFEFAAGAIKKA